MIRFVGAGPGAPDLLTLRGAELLARADCVIYAGSLVNPALLGLTKPGCALFNSAEMTLEQVIAQMEAQEALHHETVRLHTGDPSLYGAIREQMDALDARGIPYDVAPGVSSLSGAAAALQVEYTIPGVNQTVIVTRDFSLEPTGRTMLDALQAELLRGAYTEETPAALVYKATWPEERLLRCRLGDLAAVGREAGVRRTALVLVGDFLRQAGERSRLYDPTFSTGYREAEK